MSLTNLEKIGHIKIEPKNLLEFKEQIKAAKIRLRDATKTNLAIESRFDLAYNAAHTLGFAALRWQGYRPNNNRYVVFQALPFTLGVGPEIWRVLADCHSKRNLVAYEGDTEIPNQLLKDLLKATKEILMLVERLS